MVGGGGVLFYPDGNLEISFSWGLGVDTNSQDEALALWKGLQQALIHGIPEINIFGDSRLIIQVLITRKIP